MAIECLHNEYSKYKFISVNVSHWPLPPNAHDSLKILYHYVLYILDRTGSGISEGDKKNYLYQNESFCLSTGSLKPI
jgi:hypothetical protein